VSTANNFSALSSGVASAAAAPRLREESDISDKVDLNCKITIGSNLAWAVTTQPTIVGNVQLAPAATILVSVFLHGIVTRPLGS